MSTTSIYDSMGVTCSYLRMQHWFVNKVNPLLIKWPCALPVSCPGASRWFVEVCLCMALSCKAFLLKETKNQLLLRRTASSLLYTLRKGQTRFNNMII
jgi:hypothetical protein